MYLTMKYEKTIFFAVSLGRKAVNLSKQILLHNIKYAVAKQGGRKFGTF